LQHYFLAGAAGAAAGAAGASTPTLTVFIDSGLGSEFDAVLATQSLNAIRDYVWRPASGVFIAPGDSVKVHWANPDNRTYGVEAIWRRR
jgi:hypothetical protein